MYECPQCHSQDIQRYSVAYQHGTSAVEVNTYGGGAGGGGAGGGYAYSRGTSQSHLAASTAPPMRKGTFLKYLMAGIGAFFCIVGLLYLNFGNIVFGALLAGGFGYWARQCAEYNETEYPELYDRWQRSYVCLRCGHRFLMAD